MTCCRYQNRSARSTTRTIIKNGGQQRNLYSNAPYGRRRSASPTFSFAESAYKRSVCARLASENKQLRAAFFVQDSTRRRPRARRTSSCAASSTSASVAPPPRCCAPSSSNAKRDRHNSYTTHERWVTKKVVVANLQKCDDGRRVVVVLIKQLDQRRQRRQRRQRIAWRSPAHQSNETTTMRTRAA